MFKVKEKDIYTFIKQGSNPIDNSKYNINVVPPTTVWERPNPLGYHINNVDICTQCTANYNDHTTDGNIYDINIPSGVTMLKVVLIGSGGNGGNGLYPIAGAYIACEHDILPGHTYYRVFVFDQGYSFFSYANHAQRAYANGGSPSTGEDENGAYTQPNPSNVRIKHLASGSASTLSDGGYPNNGEYPAIAPYGRSPRLFGGYGNGGIVRVYFIY
jgi:hypothetical protein